MTVIALDRPHKRDPKDPWDFGDPRLNELHGMMLRFHEARSQAKGEGGRGGQFSSAILVFDPLTYTREYRELDRCLTELRRQANTRGPLIAKGVTPGQAWWNLSHRYLLCTLKRTEIHTTKTRAGHRVPRKLPHNMEVVARPTLMHGDKASVLVRVWDSAVDPAKVAAAIQWLSTEYRGVPALPTEMVA